MYSSEVSVINRRKFLAELGKLLTFMYEEDRQTALGMYEKMFDDAEDEQALLSFLVSPTRQAVVLARVYDAKARKLEVQSQSGKDSAQVSGGALPVFVSTINDIHEEALEEQSYAPVVLKDQLSFFAEESVADNPEASQNEVDTFNSGSTETASAAPIVDYSANMPDEAAAFMNDAATRNNLSTPAVTVPVSSAVPQTVQEASSPTSAPTVAPQVQPAAVEAPVPIQQPAAELSTSIQQPAVPADNPVQYVQPVWATQPAVTPAATNSTVDTFLDKLEINDEISTAETNAPVSPQPVTVAPVQPVTEQVRKDDTIQSIEQLDISSVDTADSILTKLPGSELSDTHTVRKPRIFLLILYILLAVPITALGILILLIPALLFFALAGIVVVCGFSALGSAFGSFSVFADILVVLGVSLVLIALGVLFFWIFVWFLGGAIVSLINGAIKLGGRICYKEEQVK